MNYIVDGTCMRGAAVARALHERGDRYSLVERDQRRVYHGRECRTLFFAAGNHSRRVALEDPGADFRRTIEYVSYYLHEIRFSTFVFFSDVAVYGDTPRGEFAREDRALPLIAPDSFCFHRRTAEQFVRQFAPNHLILRVPTLVAGSPTTGFELETPDEKEGRVRRADDELDLLHVDRMVENALRLCASGRRGTFNLASTGTMRAGDARRAGLDLTLGAGAQPSPPTKLSLEKAAGVCRFETSEAALGVDSQRGVA